MATYTGSNHTASRVKALEKQRQQQLDEVERQRGNIAAASASVIGNAAATDNFTAPTDAIDQVLASDTVGLVTHNDFRARRQYLERCATDRLQHQVQVERDRNRKNLAKRKRANKSLLSFQDDSERSDADVDDDNPSDGDGANTVGRDNHPNESKDDKFDKGSDNPKTGPAQNVTDNERKSLKAPKFPITKRRRLGMDPNVDTKFLPDCERELAEMVERERLKQQWLDEQEAIKNELIRITYSYWDGAGHRRVMSCKKGTTIGHFLAMVQRDFKQLRNTSADALMFIKEDLIIPHHYSFYDFIVMKARGKSGPLFNFDVVEDVRALADANKEKEDAHAAKVVERRWYERNRHIFPASRWEVYDPSKKYERYTVHGD